MAFGRDQTNRRFLHFCRSGDPDALGDVFDQTAGRLMRVAMWLLGNRADAEDLLQRTFLRAIETREQFHQGEPVLPWLMGLLGNQARQLRRERDRAAVLPPQPDRVADPEVEAAARELDAAVSAVRDRLGEPYGAVLKLHLEQGLNAKEIAAQLLRPAGTVRTQLMRALALLRQKLPGGFVGGLTAIAAVEGAALAAVRTVVITAARSAVPAAVAVGATTTATTIGGVLMTKKVLLVLPVLALLGIAAWAALRPGESMAPPAAAPIATGSVDAIADDKAADPAGTAHAAPLERRVVVDAPGTDTDPGFASLRVLVHWQRDGTPAAGVGVRLSPKQAPPLADRDAVTADDGVAVLRHVAPGAYYVVGSCLLDTDDVELLAGQQQTITAIAAPTSTAMGRVLDADGRTVADARIWVSMSSNWGIGWEVARSAADGTFTVPLRGHQYLGAHKEGHVPSYMRSFDADAGPHGDVVLQLRGAAARIHGVVRDARGMPVAWAIVLVGPRGGTGVSSGSPKVELTHPNPERLTTDAEGAFLATEVLPGDGSLWVWAPGFGPLQSPFTVSAGSTTELALTLADAAVVTGVVRDAAGKPLVATVRFGDEFGSFPSASVRADEQGRFRLGDLPAWPTGVELVAGRDQIGAKTRLQLRAGETTEWNPVLDSGRKIRGIVFGPDGAPAAALKVGAVHPNYQVPRRWHDTDASGRFELTNVGDQPRTLRVAQGEIVLAEIAGVLPDRDDVAIHLTARDLPTAKLRGRIVTADRQAVHGSVCLHREGTSCLQSLPLDATTGAFAADHLPAVRYALTAFTKESGQIDLGSIELEPDQERVLDDFVLQPAGGAELSVLDASGQPVEAGMAAVYTASGVGLGSCEVERGKGRFTALQPGRYFTEIHFTKRHEPEALTAEFEVRSAATTQVEVRGRKVVRVEVRFRDPAEPDRFLDIRATWRTEDGRIAGFARTFAESLEPMVVRGYMPVGRYRLESEVAGRIRFAAEVEVLDRPDAPRPGTADHRRPAGAMKRRRSAGWCRISAAAAGSASGSASPAPRCRSAASPPPGTPAARRSESRC